MASSVEMASAPFGCVLRDHNRCRESNARATMGAFQKNLQCLVMDHLCIAVSPKPNSKNNDHDDSCDRSDAANNDNDSRSSNKDENRNVDGVVAATQKHARVLDRWSFSRTMVAKPVERQMNADSEVISKRKEKSKTLEKPIERRKSAAEAEVHSVPSSAPSSARTSTSKEDIIIRRTDSLTDLTRKGVKASSLVQIWEKRLHNTGPNGNEMCEESSTSSGGSFGENESNANSPKKAESPVSKTGDSVFAIEGEPDFHMENARESIDESYDAGDSCEDCDGVGVDSRHSLDAKEKEKLRVMDIIRRLTSSGTSSLSEDNGNDHDLHYGSAQSSPRREFPRDRAAVDQAEQKGLPHVLKPVHATSLPRIRGRQAIADLLMQFERERHEELHKLVNQKSVSGFPQRGCTRIQSLLRLRMLQRGMASAGSAVPPLPPKPSRVNKSAQGSSIMHLREKFGTSAQDDAPNPTNSLQKEVTKNTCASADMSTNSKKHNASTSNRDVKVMEKPKKSIVLPCASEEATPSLDKSCTSNKPGESTPDREVKVIMEKQKTPGVLVASADVCKETTAKPSSSTLSREPKVMEPKKVSMVIHASKDVSDAATLVVDKSSTFNKPTESTNNLEANVMAQPKTSNVLFASEDRTPSSEKSSTSVKPSENIKEQPKTSPALRASENVIKEATPSSEATLQETTSAAQSTLPNENEIHKGKGSVVRNLDSQETAEAKISSLDQISEPTSSEARYLDSQEREDIRTPLNCGGGTGNEICRENLSEARNLDAQETADRNSSLNNWNETVLRLEAANFESQENMDMASSVVDWDENDDDYQYYGESNYDWFSEISRPRSYWEDLRNSWYQEMLNSTSEKNEIQQLLERRTVSSFLTSDFRDKIDKLMVSCVERQTCRNVSQEDEEEEEEEDDDGSFDRMNQMVAFLQQQRASASGINEEEAEQVQEQNQVEENIQDYVQVQTQSQEQEQVLDYVQDQEHVHENQDHEDEEVTEEEVEEEEDDNDADDEEESRSLISGPFLEASYYFDAASLQPSPSHFTTWSYRDHEAGDDSDRASSASPRQQSPFWNSPLRSPSPFYNVNHPQASPSLNHHPLMEMELIYDMKEHMIQLYQEMSELRKTIKSCVEMQMTMQQSMNQDVHSAQVGKKRKSSGVTKRGTCRICNEAKIDSVLYRCGHMCTCVKCAHDFQWNSGKCPICRAPIADVVKVYMDC